MSGPQGRFPGFRTDSPSRHQPLPHRKQVAKGRPVADPRNNRPRLGPTLRQGGAIRARSRAKGKTESVSARTWCRGVGFFFSAWRRPEKAGRFGIGKAPCRRCQRLSDRAGNGRVLRLFLNVSRAVGIAIDVQGVAQDAVELGNGFGLKLLQMVPWRGLPDMP